METARLNVRERLVDDKHVDKHSSCMSLSEVHASAASVTSLAPLHLPRRPTRLVSYYAFFKGWLLLSQPPSCLSLPTSFPT